MTKADLLRLLEACDDDTEIFVNIGQGYLTMVKRLISVEYHDFHGTKEIWLGLSVFTEEKT